MANTHVALVKAHKSLKWFAAHGAWFANMVTGNSGKQAIGTCPFCGKAEHFYTNIDTACWDCKSCGLSGNFGGYLTQISKRDAANIKGAPMLKLTKERGISARTMRRWDIGWNGQAYTIPARGPQSVIDIRLYRPGRKTISSPGARSWLAGYERLKVFKGNVVYVCEGEWDAMAMDEVLKGIKANAIAVGTPGAQTFKREWVQDFYGKDVVLVYDNDEGGVKGEAKAFMLLEGIARSVRCVHWPEADTLPAGFDLRDLYRQKGRNAQATYDALHAMLNDKPRVPTVAQAPDGKSDTGTQATLDGKGLPRKVVIQRYREWMHLPNVEPLDIMYGVLFGNRLEGDPLWLFMVSPPGGGKSEILMSLNKAPLIFATTSLTPHALASGASGPGGSDPSLIPILNGRVLIIKDFTAILSLPYMAKDEIFGTLRDIYDGELTKVFGNNIIRHYKSRFGIIAGVTPDIEAHTTTHVSLGARFLYYRIRVPGRINVGGDIIGRAIDNTIQEASMRGDLQAVAYEALNRKITVSDAPKLNAVFKKRLVGLAQWVASMRAVVAKERYTREILYTPSAELGTRLGKQLAKLAIGVGVYKQAEQLGEEHYRLVVKVARDTAPSRSEEIIRRLWLNGGIDDYVPTGSVVGWTGLNQETCRNLLQDLTILKVLQKEGGPGMGDRWRISPSMVRLMRPLELYKEEEAWKRRVGK